MAKAYDITLQDKETSPSITLGLVLAEDDSGKRWREFRIPPIPPRQSQGALQWTHKDPLSDFTWAMDDWSGGALRPYYRQGDARYARSHNVDARWEGVLTLGMKAEGQSDFLLRNPGAERGSTFGWTAGAGITLTTYHSSRFAHSGDYAFGVATDGARSVGDPVMYQDLANPKAYRGRTISAIVYVNRLTNSSADLRLVIYDGIGSTIDTRTLVTGSYVYYHVTRTIDPNATMVRIQLEFHANETTQSNYFVDDFIVVPEGGVQWIGVARAAEEALVANPDAEDPAVNPWTTVTRTTAKSYTGNASWTASVAAGTTFTDWVTIDVAKARGKWLFAGVKCTQDGSVTIDGGVSVDVDGTVTTNSASLSSATWIARFVPVWVPDDATTVRVGLYANNTGTANDNVYWDEVFVIATPSDALYAACGRLLLKWDATDQAWDAVYYHTDAISTIAGVAGFVAAGTADNSIISGVGTDLLERSAGSITLSGRPAVAAVRDVYWAARKNYDNGPSVVQVDQSYLPSLAGSPPTYLIGDRQHSITAVHPYADSVVVVKPDGLHVYDRTLDEFKNVSQEWANEPDPNNFTVAVEWKGWLYVAPSKQGLLRWNSQYWEDLSSLLANPRLKDFGGRVRAMTTTPHELLFLLDTPQTDSDPLKTTWLMSLREVGGELKIHTLAQVSIGDIGVLYVHDGLLHALGSVWNADLNDYVSSTAYWRLPSKTVAPAYDADPSIASRGWLETCVWHGDMPDTPKAFLRLDVWCEDVDASHTISVGIGVDGATPITNLGTITQSGIVSLYFATLPNPTTDAVGRAIQLKFTLTTNDKLSPKIYAFALHSTLRPPRNRAWEFIAEVGALRTGLPDPRTDVASLLASLETQTYPIVLKHDLDEDGVEETVKGHILTFERQGREGNIYRIVFQEA